MGGRVDYFIMRLADLVWALPGLLIAIVVVGVIGGGYYVAVVVLIVLTFPVDARIVRGATLQQRNMPYVEAAATLGLSPWRLMIRHIWPNLLPLVMANTFLNFCHSTHRTGVACSRRTCRSSRATRWRAWHLRSPWC